MLATNPPFEESVETSRFLEHVNARGPNNRVVSKHLTFSAANSRRLNLFEHGVKCGGGKT